MKNAIYVERTAWANDLLGYNDDAIIGVEVGLWKADFALNMLQTRKNLVWYGVDPYAPYGRKRRKQDAWDVIYDRVFKKMLPFKERFTMVREFSHEAIPHLPQEVDYIFIDGNHDYDFVLRDLRLYEPLLISGGIMSGHDYTTPKDGVRRAVNEYVNTHGRELNVDSSFDKSGVYWWQFQH